MIPATVAARPMCSKCGAIRLSVADAGGVCLFCLADAEAARKRAEQAAPPHPNWCRCGRGPKVYRGLCRPCNREHTQRYRAEHPNPAMGRAGRPRRQIGA